MLAAPAPLTKEALDQNPSSWSSSPGRLQTHGPGLVLVSFKSRDQEGIPAKTVPATRSNQDHVGSAGVQHQSPSSCPQGIHRPTPVVIHSSPLPNTTMFLQELLPN